MTWWGSARGGLVAVVAVMVIVLDGDAERTREVPKKLLPSEGASGARQRRARRQSAPEKAERFKYIV